MKLSVLLATRGNYSEIWTTVHILKEFHDLTDCEILIGDIRANNNIEQQIRLLSKNACEIRYFPIKDQTSAKNLLIDQARSPAILYLDAGVILAQDVLAKLKTYHETHPECLDFLQGPLKQNCHCCYMTHWVDVNGVGQAAQCWKSQTGDLFSGIPQDEKVAFYKLGLGLVPMTGCLYPDNIPWVGHELAMKTLGHVRMGGNDEDEFEIPSQSLRMFSCRKDAWLGDGVEFVLHQRYRNAGQKCLCLGFLKWMCKMDFPPAAVSGRGTAVPSVPTAIPAGHPGGEMLALTREMGVSPKAGCDCNALAAAMDILGCEPIKLNLPIKDYLAKRIGENAKKWHWHEKVLPGLRALLKRHTSYQSLIDEAVSRAEKPRD